MTVTGSPVVLRGVVPLAGGIQETLSGLCGVVHFLPMFCGFPPMPQRDCMSLYVNPVMNWRPVEDVP